MSRRYECPLCGDGRVCYSCVHIRRPMRPGSDECTTCDGAGRLPCLYGGGTEECPRCLGLGALDPEPETPDDAPGTDELRGRS